MSRREDASRLADIILLSTKDDHQQAITNATTGATFAWWDLVARSAGVEFPDALTRQMVITVLRSRQVNSNDPFTGFPR